MPNIGQNILCSQVLVMGS